MFRDVYRLNEFVFFNDCPIIRYTRLVRQIKTRPIICTNYERPYVLENNQNGRNELVTDESNSRRIKLY